jgi:hypothetical protein
VIDRGFTWLVCAKHLDQPSSHNVPDTKSVSQLHVPFPSLLSAPSVLGSMEDVEEMLMTRAGSLLFESFLRRSVRLKV